MHTDVKKIVGTVIDAYAQSHISETMIRIAPNGPIPVTKVWHRLGIDLLGPLPKTEACNKDIIKLCDYFSKWPETVPLQFKCSEGVDDFQFIVCVDILAKNLTTLSKN